MPDLRQRNKPIAILASDIHLSHTPPVFRSDEDWYEAMRRPLRELSELAGSVPVVIAGDIFDRWNSPPELINFAMKELPEKVYAIPGQHDLPNHSLEEMHRSAYGVLVRSGRIRDITEPTSVESLCLHPFPWGREVTPLTEAKWDLAGVNIAVIHAYCWKKGFSHPLAFDGERLSAWEKKVVGYDLAVFGDNHQGFTQGPIINCGGFMIRKSDERDRKPAVYILYSDKTYVQHALDTSLDKYLDLGEVKDKEDPEIVDFVSQLQQLSADPLNFREMVVRYVSQEGISPGVKSKVLEVLG